jgi:hypothetical protein
MAFTWFAGAVVEGLVAGLLVGVIVREARSTAGPAVP